jgi:multiple sugar transport system permease protein
MQLALTPSYRKVIRSGTLNLIRFSILFALGSIFVVPFYWMVSTSFKTPGQAYLFPPAWIPDPVSLDSYRSLWGTAVPFNLFIRNTVVIVVFTVIGTLLSSTLVAFAFARLKWWGRDFWFIVLLATLMLPYQVIMIPVYVIFRKLGWLDTYLPLIVPAYLGNAFYIFLIRQFFLTIPNDLEDAARVDGASSLRILLQIFLPNSKPVLLTVMLFAFVAGWNDFFGPLLYLRKLEQMTVSVGLSMFAGYRSPNWPAITAASTLSILPIVVMFVLFQRYFVKGIVLTGMKG